jgi:signal transduction histidine kinase
VLNFAKLEAGRVAFDLREVELREVLEATAPLVEPQRAARGLAWTMHLPEAPCVVWADRDKLTQVLLNLLANAVKFTAPGGTIAVRVHAPADAPDEARVEVVDTGVGIPADQLEAIFEPFVQLGAEGTPRHEGTGLGLTISRDLARGMGGELIVRSAPGDGSTFVLTLRRAHGMSVRAS